MVRLLLSTPKKSDLMLISSGFDQSSLVEPSLVPTPTQMCLILCYGPHRIPRLIKRKCHTNKINSQIQMVVALVYPRQFGKGKMLVPPWEVNCPTLVFTKIHWPGSGFD